MVYDGDNMVTTNSRWLRGIYNCLGTYDVWLSTSADTHLLVKVRQGSRAAGQQGKTHVVAALEWTLEVARLTVPAMLIFTTELCVNSTT